MKFSIRAMLAFTFLIALALLAGRTLVDLGHDSAEIAALQNEVAILKTQLAAELHQQTPQTQDSARSIQAMRDRAIEQFDVIRNKYSSIESRGPEVVSIRRLPSLEHDNKSAQTPFRLSIPEKRSVWLKCGVHAIRKGSCSSRPPNQEDDLSADSPLSESGPFEMLLPTGDAMIQVLTEVESKTRSAVVVRLNGQAVLRATFASDDGHTSGKCSISAQTQIDFGPKRELPWLMTHSVGGDASLPKDKEQKIYAISLWLSDHSSDFQSFPTK